MKMLTAKVIDGQLDLPDGTLEEGVTVTLLVPEHEEGFESEIVLTPETQNQLWQAWVEKGPQGPIEEDDEPELP